jgi:hypothetical protein
MSTSTSSKHFLQFLQFYYVRLTYPARASSITSVTAYRLQLQFGFPSWKALFINPSIATSLFWNEMLSKPWQCYNNDSEFPDIIALFMAQVFLWTRRALCLCSRCSAMHATNVERNSGRLPPDDTVQVADQRSKSAEVSLTSGCTPSSISDTVKTGLLTPQSVTGHDPTAVPPVPYSNNALPWVLDPLFWV